MKEKSLRDSVLKKRYFIKDENGDIKEDWNDLCMRVSDTIAFTDKEQEDFYNVMKNCDFLPNSPVLMNAGINENFTYSACFVIPLEDSMESIMDAVKQSALISKMGGGCGYNFSTLRPKDSKVGSTGGVASGALSFMEIFDTTCEIIKQGGKRRGAQMSILHVWHPDIEEFINAKLKDGRYTNFNFSVGITDDFMEAVKDDSDWDLIWDDEIVKTVKAKYLWDKITNNAYKNGEPGVIFLDIINENYILKDVCNELAATNPCAETPLHPKECCVLGSINLSNFYRDNGNSDWDWDNLINWKRLHKTIGIAVRFLDNIIDKQQYPNEEFEEFHKKNRKIGLGIMGFADLMIKLKVKYGSDQSFKIAKAIMSHIQVVSHEYSEKLAIEQGIPENLLKTTCKRRNATVTCIAPTGTLSIIAECSSGIEPNFAFKTHHNRMNEKYTTYHPLAENHWSSINGSPLPGYFITAEEIDPEDHIKMQSVFQEHTDLAVSKTINLPSDASINDVKKAYELAYELKCKGVTVYRDGSRNDQVLSTSVLEKKKEVNNELQLPEVMEAKRIRIDTIEGKVFINVSHTDNMPFEIFIHHPADTKHAETYESLARLISTCLKNNVQLLDIIDQLNKAHVKYGSINSVCSAIIKALKLFENKGISKEKCPDCNEVIILEEGCKKCHSCGYSACS